MMKLKDFSVSRLSSNPGEPQSEGLLDKKDKGGRRWDKDRD